jgi:hypothetical protein
MEWDRTTDRYAAHNSAHDALGAIEALQSTETWLLLPLDVQRQISRTHGLLAGLAAGMVDEEIV